VQNNFPKKEMAVAERVHSTDVFRRESPIAKPAPSTGYFRGGRVGARPGAVHHWLEEVFLPTVSLLVLAVLGILTVSQPVSVAAQIDLPEGTLRNVDVELNAPAAYQSNRAQPNLPDAPLRQSPKVSARGQEIRRRNGITCG
jgi:hypothetical protein